MSKAKNYVILIALLAGTILVTLILANFYVEKTRQVSGIYSYSNKINVNEFDQYSIENPNTIIYISDKYDLNNVKFEERLIYIIDKLNYKSNFIYIEKSKINDKFITLFKTRYGNSIEINENPILIVISDGKLSTMSYINENSDPDTIIDYEVFE